jgi:hypothetical protein
VKKMKHRSTHIFILLAAFMVAAPQVSQELSALRSAVSRHVKCAIVNAFLDLQAGAAARPAPAVADSLLASSDAAGEPSAAARKSAGQPRPATQVEVHARREVPAEAAEEVRTDVVMLADPAVELAAAQTEWAAHDFKFELHDVKVMPGRELAMLTPPADEVAEVRAAAHREAAEVRRLAARQRRADRSKQEAAAVLWRLADELKREQGVESELRGRLDALRVLDAGVRELAPRGPAKTVKPKRTARPAPAAPAARPAPANCPARQLACGPSIPESIFASE